MSPGPNEAPNKDMISIPVATLFPPPRCSALPTEKRLWESSEVWFATGAKVVKALEYYAAIDSELHLDDLPSLPNARCMPPIPTECTAP